jgi:predicted permease
VSWTRFFPRAYWDAERTRELQSYLDIETDDNIARGLPPDQARYAAMRKLGNVTRIREEIYEMNTLGLTDAAFQDLRYGWRTLRTNPGFAAVAIFSLAIGIGSNVAIFQLLDAVRLRALPVRSADQLVEVKLERGKGGRTGEFWGRRPQMTSALYGQVLQHQRSFEGVLAWGTNRFNLSPGGEVQPANGLWVSGSYFEVLGVGASVGRVLHPGDDQPGCGGTPPAVISHMFWQRHFGGETSVVGRQISLDNHRFEIVGVTPPAFFGVEVGRTFDVAVPLCAEPLVNGEDNATSARDHWWLAVLGRLPGGVSPTDATRALQTLSPGIFEATLPTSYAAADVKNYLALRLTTEPAVTGVSGLRSAYGTSLWMLLGIAGLVLFIACANLANLLLARATAREQEIAVRLAIGASRWRVTRQLMTESLLLATLGALAGLVVAGPLSRFLVAFLSTDDAPLFLDLQPHWHILIFTAGVALAASMIFGAAPAIRATRARSGTALQGGARSVRGGGERFGLRRGLVVAQLAVSLVLVVGALLFASTLRNLLTLDAGMRQDGVLIVSLDYSGRQVPVERRGALSHRLLERVQGLPVVTSAAASSNAPLSGHFWNENVLVGASPESAGLSNLNRVSADYFKTMGVNVLSGRVFAPTDGLGSPPVAVVSQAFASRLLRSPNPLGKTFRFVVGPGRPVTEYQVVGLVNDTKYSTLREAFEPLAYLADSQDRKPDNGLRLVVRSDAPVSVLAPAIKQVIADVDPAILIQFQTLRSSVVDSLLPERLMALLASFFGLLATGLAVVGLYGLTTYMVARRRREIGIRMTLGADQRSVVGLIMRECVMLLAVGLPAGAVAAVFAARAAASMLFGVPNGALALVGAATGLMALIGLAANYLPARRAGLLRPVDALRSE